MSGIRQLIMMHCDGMRRVAAGLVRLSWAMLVCGLVCGLACGVACGQQKTVSGQQEAVGAHVTVTVVDENGQAVEGAQVTIAEPGA